MLRVARISITPLKSTSLQHPERVYLGRGGVVENRRFFLVDASGRLVGIPQHPSLVQVEARYDLLAERLALRLPDGTVVEGSGIAGGDCLSVDFWGRPTPGRVVDGPLTDAISAFLDAPVRVVRATEDGGGCDDQPVTIASTASAEELARRAGREAIDARRFRMLFEIDGAEAHQEDGWRGQLVRIGEAVVRVGGPVPRCDVTQRDPSTGARDLETLRIIHEYRGRSASGTVDFGVYGEVTRPGHVAVGDPVVLPGD